MDQLDVLQALSYINAIIGKLPPEQQAKVQECRDKLKDICLNYGWEGAAALGLLTVEMGAEMDKVED